MLYITHQYLVSNLAPELNHLLEEISAKDNISDDCRSIIHSRDASIQKFLKTNSISVVNPKEDLYSKTVLSNFDKLQSLQDEKVALADKARILVRTDLQDILSYNI